MTATSGAQQHAAAPGLAPCAAASAAAACRRCRHAAPLPGGRLKGKQPPEGWELIEEVIDDFEQQMKDAVNEDTSGKRRNETTWKVGAWARRGGGCRCVLPACLRALNPPLAPTMQVTRIHWEKNRFIFDLMYNRKVMSRDLYDWLVREKIADGALIAKWRKPGYEILCSLLAIQKGNHNFGTTSHCRVPMRQRAAQQRITPDVQTGCICCASGDGRFGGPIWWNTPLEETDEGAEQNRATWGQGKEEPAEQQGGEERQHDAPSRKRQLEAGEDEDEIDDEVKRRLAALKG